MSAYKRQMAQISSSRPIGEITPIGDNGYGRDEAGRIYSIMPIEQINAIQKAKQIGKDNRKFSFTNMIHLREIVADLSNKYCGYILLLQPHIQFKTNLLVVSDSDTTPLTIDDIAKIIDVQPRTANTVIKKLKAKDIVFETEQGFRINERYHFRKRAGGEVETVIKTFFTALKQLNVSPADLGFVYKLLPNVHYETNIICADPFVENAADIRFLNEKQIAKLVGMSDSKTKETLARLRKAGVVGEWINGEDKREVLTVLNPYVFYRKKGQPDKTLQALFAAKRFGA
jgi:DNA-binding transcriptional regulator YhcF (GntR family)